MHRTILGMLVMAVFAFASDRATAAYGDPAPTPLDSCKCYCGSHNLSIGAVACVSGYKYACIARLGAKDDCAWSATSSACDGTELCR